MGAQISMRVQMPCGGKKLPTELRSDHIPIAKNLLLHTIDEDKLIGLIERIGKGRFAQALA